MNSNNIYGIQKVPETEVRKGLDVATDTATSAAQGAKMLSALGPFGTAAGAVVGGAIGYFGSKAGQKKEAAERFTEENDNKFVDSLSGRQATNTRYVAPQARKGLKLSKYKQVEAEGDGTGAGGVGEFHLDKNYNVKKITSGEPTHEEGGKNLAMTKGDIILSPREQSDNSPLSEVHRGKFNKIKLALNKYKLTGDSTAKKFIDEEVAKIPKDSTVARKGAINPPFVSDEVDKSFGWNNPTNEEVPPYLSNLIKQPASTKAAYAWGLEKYNKKPLKQYEGEFESVKYGDKKEPYNYKVNRSTGETLIQKKGDKDWTPGSANGNNNDKLYEVLTGEKYMSPAVGGKQSVSPIIKTNPNQGANTQPSIAGSKSVFEEQNLFPDKKHTKDKETDKSTVKKKPVVYDRDAIPTYNSPWKYSNALFNTAMGASPAEKVNRRTISQEDYVYQDTSQTQRNALNTSANAARARARGTRLSSGQSISNNAQITAATAGGMDAINERETDKRQAVYNQNVQQRNATKQANIARYDVYDQQDMQSKAAKYSFKGEAARDMTKLGDLEEQRKYSQSRNKKQYQMDNVRLKAMNNLTSKYAFTPDELELIYKD